MTDPTNEPLVVITADSHVTPDVERDLSPYCPASHRERYDEWLRATQPVRDAMRTASVFGGSLAPEEVHRLQNWNLQTDGHRDVAARLGDMDRDGVAAEVIFHGGPPGDSIPFLLSYIGKDVEDARLAAVGQRMYNRWLADLCSVEPERHVGLAHLPMWDVDAAIEEVRWARAAGLRGVNFPQSRAEITPYEDASWEPFWAVCEELDMPLVNHGGAGASTPRTTGPLATHIYSIESNALSRVSPLARLVFGGVFERHPGLKLVQTEQVGDWFRRVADELDSRWEKWQYAVRDVVPKPPSEYCHTNYFVGASFQSRAEAEAAIRDGYADNVLWGSDYPHPEGTFRFDEDGIATPVTRLALRNTYGGLPHSAVRGILADNAVRVYGFDRPALERVAARIGAPTWDELDQPIDAIPDHWGLAFRETALYN
jgi:predicted TIM-barrel fold metal-dependent hydrolase